MTTHTDPELHDLSTHWGMPYSRRLPDGSIAGLQRLTTTWSLMLGVERWYHSYRFCFQTLEAAVAALGQVQSEDDIPDGWIACRPEVRVGHGPDERYPTPDELRQLRAQYRSTT